MADYLAQRIIDGALQYAAVVSKFSALKSGIDAYLTQHSRADLITS